MTFALLITYRQEVLLSDNNIWNIIIIIFIIIITINIIIIIIFLLLLHAYKLLRV